MSRARKPTEAEAPTAPIEPLYRFEEWPRILNCSRRTVERMMSSGKLPKPDLRIGRSPRWRPETVRVWIENGGAK